MTDNNHNNGNNNGNGKERPDYHLMGVIIWVVIVWVVGILGAGAGYVIYRVVVAWGAK